MKKLHISLLTLALGFAFSAGTMAQGMSEIDYKDSKDKIAETYKSNKASCDALSGNPKDICEADAKGREKVSLAELEATYKPSSETHYQLRVAKAEADSAVAKERCDDLAGNAKDVCVKKAEAAETTAKADAEVQMKTSEANATANEKSGEARSDASSETADARKDAAEQKLDAQYKVAKEKCDTFADDAKDRCLDEAKARFEK